MISSEEGTLYYQRGDNPKYRLIPMGDDWFILDGLDYFRIKFDKNSAGTVDKLVGHYDNGHIDSNERNEAEVSEAG